MTTETRALVHVSKPLADNMTIARAFAQSGMFPGIKEQSQAVVKILAGQELGFGAVYSMMKIHFIQGQLALSAEAMAALIKRSGTYSYQITKHTDTECVMSFLDNGKAVYESKWTLEDAKRAGVLKSGSGWEKFPRAMLFARALSQGARIVCPHVIMGTYTAEELGAEVDEQGEVITVPVEVIDEAVVQTATATEQKGHWCPIHKVAFKRWEKEGRVWYSHGIKGTDQWCNEKVEPTEPVSPDDESPPEDETPEPDEGEKTKDISEEQFREALTKLKWSGPRVAVAVQKCKVDGIRYADALRKAMMEGKP